MTGIIKAGLTNAELRATPPDVIAHLHDEVGTPFSSVNPLHVELVANSSSVEASYNYGTVVGLAVAATSNIVSIPSSVDGYRISGFAATGLGDGYFFIQINGVTIVSARTNNMNRSVSFLFPNPITTTVGSAITFRVTNEADGVTNYEGTLLGAHYG